jgi:hypothetical protein
MAEMTPVCKSERAALPFERHAPRPGNPVRIKPEDLAAQTDVQRQPSTIEPKQELLAPTFDRTNSLASHVALESADGSLGAASRTGPHGGFLGHAAT